MLPNAVVSEVQTLREDRSYRRVLHGHSRCRRREGFAPSGARGQGTRAEAAQVRRSGRQERIFGIGGFRIGE